MTEELKPCPAGHASARVIGGPGTAGGPKFWAGCDDCNWRAWGDTQAEAIAAWNTRPEQPMTVESNPDGTRPFAWTATSGWKAYPPFVNLAGNRLSVRGHETIDRNGHQRTGPQIELDLPDEAIDELRAALSAVGESRPIADPRTIVGRLCELHERLLRCFQGATGQHPPRRPNSFTPEWKDTDTVLDAAVALERKVAAVGESREGLIAAYRAGAEAVHEHWANADEDEWAFIERDEHPDFTDAAHDYATEALTKDGGSACR